eukprot:167880_1
MMVIIHLQNIKKKMINLKNNMVTKFDNINIKIILNQSNIISSLYILGKYKLFQLVNGINAINHPWGLIQQINVSIENAIYNCGTVIHIDKWIDCNGNGIAHQNSMKMINAINVESTNGNKIKENKYNHDDGNLVYDK